MSLYRLQSIEVTEKIENIAGKLQLDEHKCLTETLSTLW